MKILPGPTNERPNRFLEGKNEYAKAKLKETYKKKKKRLPPPVPIFPIGKVATKPRSFANLMNWIYVIVVFLCLHNEIRSFSSIFPFQFHKIGVILHEADLTGADSRFKQSVEVFWLQGMQEKYTIEPCGLFVVDMVLVQGVSNQ